MKREKLNLGEKVAVICEGGAETAIMEMLLDAGRLIFTEEDLFYDEIIRCRSAEIFEQRYLKSRKWVKEYFKNIDEQGKYLEHWGC